MAAIRQFPKPLLSPYLTGPLLLSLLFFPDRIRSITPLSLQRILFSDRLSTILKLLFFVKTLSKLNKYFSHLAANNFVTDKTWDWSKEIVLITGGSSGIGASIAQKLSSRGIKVVNLDLAPPKEKTPSNQTFIKTDITSTSEIAAAATHIRTHVGSPTVLINNAGIGSCALILEESIDRIQKTFDVNTVSHFKMVKEFLPDMIKGDHGHVVTIASFASYVVNAQNVDYACSKASALAFHEGLGSELRNRYGAKKVRTTIVNPTWVATPLITDLIEHSDWKSPVLKVEGVAEAIVQQVLSGKGGQIILPEGLKYMTGVRGWPAWLQYRLINSVAMDLAIISGAGIEGATGGARSEVKL